MAQILNIGPSWGMLNLHKKEETNHCSLDKTSLGYVNLHIEPREINS